MRVIPTFVALAALLCAATIFRTELAGQARAERLLVEGASLEAFDAYGALADSRPLFLDRRELGMRRETAATSALPRAVAAHNFTRAQQLVTTILGGVDSGLEAEARAAASKLPVRHVEWASRLLSDGKLDEAIGECEVIRALYGDSPAIRGQVGLVETRAMMTIADRALGAGDPVSALDAVARLDPEAPFSVRTRASAVAAQAATLGAQFRLSTRDYPGLLRWLASSREKVHARADLRAAVARVHADHAARVFGLPGLVPELLDVDEPPSPVAVGSSAPGVAQVTVENRTGRALSVLLRGPRDYRTVVAAGGSRTLRVRPGEYAQAAHGGSGSTVVPYLGVVEFSAEAYYQVFVIIRLQEPDRPRPASARLPVVVASRSIRPVVAP